MLNRNLFLIGLFLIVFALVAFVSSSIQGSLTFSQTTPLRGDKSLWSTPPPGATPLQPKTPPLATPVATASPTAPAIVEMDSPQRLEVGPARRVRISLVKTNAETALAPGAAAGPASGFAISTPLAVPGATPSASLQDAFGPDYTAFAVAHLVGSDVLHVEPLEGTVQVPLADLQPRITWDWNVSATIPGTHPLTADIEILWKPRNGGETRTYQIWKAYVDIQAEQQLFTLGQVNILALLSGLVGSGLSVPFLLAQLQAYQKGLKKKEGLQRKGKHRPT